MTGVSRSIEPGCRSSHRAHFIASHRRQPTELRLRTISVSCQGYGLIRLEETFFLKRCPYGDLHLPLLRDRLRGQRPVVRGDFGSLQRDLEHVAKGVQRLVTDVRPPMTGVAVEPH